MEKVVSSSEFNTVSLNKIVGKCEMKNSLIEFSGSNNVVFFENDTVLVNSKLRLWGDNSLIYFRGGNKQQIVNIDIYSNSVIHIGKDCYCNGILTINVSEQKHFFCGDNCLFSFGCMIRTADPHLIYDIETKKRINESKSVFFGDSIWMGQDCLILKGTQVGSGCIIGAKSVVSNKVLDHNSVYAGNPVRKVKENIFWDKTCVHRFDDKLTFESMKCDSEDNIFERIEKDLLPFQDLERCFSLKISAMEKIKIFESINNNKNRFAL